MAPIGTELKRERELRGITLQEISDATKINIRYLRELEEDRFDNLPGTFFIKGIIRSYAKYIGLDENTILNGYYETELLREQEKEGEKKSQKTHTQLPIKVKRIIFSILLFIVLMAILTAVYFIFQREPEPPNKQAEIIPKTQNTIPAPPPETKKVIEQKELVLDLFFVMETWIQIYADGELVVDGLKLEGEDLQVTAKEEFLIHTGNAGGMTFTLNDKEGIPFGEPGIVRRDILIRHENIDSFIEQKKNFSL